MRVAFINSVCGTGSTGKIVTGLLRSVRSTGGDGRIFFGVGEAHDVASGDAVRYTSSADYYVHNAFSRLTDHAGCYSSGATRRMIAAIEDYDPDLIHLHNLHGYYLNTDLLFAYLKDCGRKVVWTLHDCWAFTGHCTHFTSAACEQWKTGCEHCVQLRRYPKCLLWGDVRRNFARKKAAFTALPYLTLVTPSEWLADTVRQSFLGKYEVLPIPNGVDTKLFRPTKGNIRSQLGLRDGDKLALGVASVWNARKGLSDLAALARLLPEDWRLLIIGVREDQKASLPESVLTLGRIISQTELAQFYSAADVFVNPSYEETMGLTTAEALACGTPAVVYDQTAVPEVVDETSGIVVPAGDVKALCHAVTTCRLRREDARARGERYALARQNNRHLQLYRRLLHDDSDSTEVLV